MARSGERCAQAIGALLAGGAARRLGGAGKAGLELAGAPLAARPAAALRAVCERLAVICKPDTELPELPGFERWDEPAEPRHPLTGIVYALTRARGAPVLVCAADMPWVGADALRSLLAAAREQPSTMAVVAEADGRLQPVLAVYRACALGTLASAAPRAPLTATVEALAPLRVALAPGVVRSVNTPEQLAEAERELGGEGRSSARGPGAPPAERC